MRNILILILLSLTLRTSLAQDTKYEIKHFSPEEYGKGHESSNWACVQDSQGLLYFGNAGGILLYDGVEWSFISLMNRSVWVKALSNAPDGRIYVGAQQEFGYLSGNQTGYPQYVSLSDSLGENRPYFSDIIRVWNWNDTVVFQSEESLFLYSKGHLSTILPGTSFHLSFLVDSTLYIRERDRGILRFREGRLVQIPGSEVFSNRGIFAILEGQEPGSLLVICREDGIWKVHPGFEAEQVYPKGSELLMKAGIYGAIRLSDNNIALNTLSSGIIICDPDLNVLKVVNKNSGLKVNGVLGLMQDYQDNLWACLDNGIVQLKYSSPLSFYGPESGLTGIVRGIGRSDGNLLIGTTDGLFQYQEDMMNGYRGFGISGKFNKEVRAMCEAGSSLLVASQYGLFEAAGNEVKLIYPEEFQALYYDSALNLLFAVNRTGIRIMQKENRWKTLRLIDGIRGQVTKIQTSALKGEINVWLGTSLDGVVRLKGTCIDDFHLDVYNESDGLTGNTWVIPFSIGQKVYFSQPAGLLQFADEESLKANLPDSLKNRPEFTRGYFEFVDEPLLADYSKMPFYASLDAGGRVYANIDGETGYLDQNQPQKWITDPFVLSEAGKTNVFYREDNGICWIGGDNGLLRFDENRQKDYSVPFKTLIASVKTHSDSLLFSDYLSGENPAPVLDYQNNGLVFNFSAPFFEGPERIRYSWKLDGFSKSFGPWQTQASASFSNLREGQYTLRVKGRNSYGVEGEEALFSFTVLPPWYRTNLAYSGYIVILLVSVYGGMRLNSRRLREKNKKLETIIEERTREIKKQNTLLAKQKEEILDSINYAKRIQEAVLPDPDESGSWLGEHFILFRPKDIVSGDFYWATQKNNKVYFCVADCTGHGVPGAFMSMLCISLLNEVVLKEGIAESNLVLDKLRHMIVEALKQKGIEGEQKDGMDIALCVLDRFKMELEYSGANNNLYLVRNQDLHDEMDYKILEMNGKKLYDIKADNMPIAIHVNMSPFKKNKIRLLKGDCLYLLSDGFADQFGGPPDLGKGKKFLSKALKTALLESAHLPMPSQGLELEMKLNGWMSYRNGDTGLPYEQVDDICIMGIRV